MTQLTNSYKLGVLNNAIHTLYYEDSIKLQTEKEGILLSAIHLSFTEPGLYKIYYEGETYDCMFPDKKRIPGSMPIYLDLPNKLHTAFDIWIAKNEAHKSEIHDVKGVIRSVLNLSETAADVDALMPKMVKERCSHLFSAWHSKITLSAIEIEECNLKHSKMLKGIKQRVLRDLLKKSR